MSLKYRDKNGAEVVLAGLTPGGDIEYGAVATRKGNYTISSAVAAQTGDSATITFSEPMPDNDYEIIFNTASARLALISSEKTVNGFKLSWFNTSDSATAATVILSYTAFKLYTVADAETLYSKVLDIEEMIPSSASSTNKFATADDLRTETRTLDRRLDDVEDVIPSSASITNKLATAADVEEAMENTGLPVCSEVPSSPEDKDVMLYIGDETGFTKGGIYQYVADPGAWVLISTADVDLSKYETSWTGTKAEWDALSADEKKQYKIANITDDVIGGEVADEVTDGLMSPVTSNAVYDKFVTLSNAVVMGMLNLNHTSGDKTLTLDYNVSDYRYIELKLVVGESSNYLVLNQMLLGFAEVAVGQTFRLEYYSASNAWQRFDVKYYSETTLTVTRVSGTDTQFKLMVIGREPKS